MSRGETASVTSPAGFWSRRARASWAGLYIIGIGAVALGLLCLLIFFQVEARSLLPSGSFPWSGLVLLMAVGIFAERYTVRLGSGMEVSASFLAFFLSAAIAGPLASFLTAVTSQIPLVRRRELERGLCFSSALGIAAGGTALFYWALLGRFGGSDDAAAITVAVVGLAAGVFFQMLNYAVFLPVGLLRHGKGPVTAWREGFLPFLPFHFFFLAISLGLIAVYRIYGTSTLNSTFLIMLCLLPVFGGVYVFQRYADQRTLARYNARLARRNERLFIQAVATMITILDMKDNYTARHSAAVAQWATEIAARMNLSEGEIHVTHLASLLHDVGKIVLSDDVLKYPGELNAEGWAQVRAHSRNGHKILNEMDQLDQHARAVLHHHERYDGKGYPMRLAGEEIPLISRIICVADSYSAMVTDRPYRAKLSAQAAKSELIANRGTQFDPQVVETFLSLLEEHGDDYQDGAKADFLGELEKVKSLPELPSGAEEEDDIAGSGAAA
jgi:hypothetical protein